MDQFYKNLETYSSKFKVDREAFEADMKACLGDINAKLVEEQKNDFQKIGHQLLVRCKQIFRAHLVNRKIQQNTTILTSRVKDISGFLYFLSEEIPGMIKFANSRP